MPPILSTRALNRALLARQWLLQRRTSPIEAAIEHLVGLQAQSPQSPYYALEARLEGFRPQDMSLQLERREAVRGTLYRGTIHWVTVRDWLAIRPLIQPVLEHVFSAQRAFAAAVRGIDVDAVRAEGRALLAEQPRTGSELGRLLQPLWPDRDGRQLAFAVQYLEPVVQVPPRGLWGRTGQALLAPSSTWLGRDLDAAPSVDDLVLRYLAAFGPASPADVRTWSGLSGARDILERLRPGLMTFRDQRGGELFDLSDAPRPDPDTPAPPRFLPDYDNAFLAHADRTRIVSDEHRRHWANGSGTGSHVFLVDGFGAGLWRVRHDRAGATLLIGAHAQLRSGDRDGLEAEGARLLRFAAPDAVSHRIEFAAQPRG